jgi:hypothetical protein
MARKKSTFSAKKNTNPSTKKIGSTPPRTGRFLKLANTSNNMMVDIHTYTSTI